MHEALHTVAETIDAITSRSAAELTRLIEAGYEGHSNDGNRGASEEGLQKR